MQKTKNGVTTFYNGKPNEDGICFLEEKNSSVTKIESFRKNLYRIKSENAAGSANEFSVDAAANSISFQGVKIKITK